MNLKNTELLLKSLGSEGELDTYAISVQCGDRQAHLFSDCADADTLFDVASMGKILVTAPLILRLVGEGAVDLEDPLTRFFPDVPPDKTAITVRQLLTHTSGIVRIEFPPEIADADRDAVDACILRVPLAFRPGTDYRYSCNGYILLGHILERVTGLPLDRLFRETLFHALGLTRTCFAPAAETPNLAVCCEREQVGSTPVDDPNVRKLHGIAGSGANFWTVGILKRSFGPFGTAARPCMPLPSSPRRSRMPRRTLRRDRGSGIWWQTAVSPRPVACSRLAASAIPATPANPCSCAGKTGWPSCC